MVWHTSPAPADRDSPGRSDVGGTDQAQRVADDAGSKVVGGRMIRSELLQALAKQSPSMRGEEIERVVDVFFDEIAKRLAEGGRVELRGFGAFSTRERDARKGRNPRTGDSVEVPGKRVPYFKPGKDMRLRLNAE